MVFDSSTRVSAVWIEGEEGSVMTLPTPSTSSGRRLTATYDSTMLFSIMRGAPPVHVRGMRLAGGVRVEAGLIDLDNCTLDGSWLGTQPAVGVQVTGGLVRLNSTVLANFGSGGMSVTSGRVEIDGSVLRGNGHLPAATFGALQVGDANGGGDAHVTITSTRIEANGYARESCEDLLCVRGGGLKVVGGNVVLRAGTILRNNVAFEGNTIYVDTSLVRDLGHAVMYRLPVRRGHHVIITDRGDVAPLSQAIVDDTYPFECSGGRYGNAEDHEREAQSSPRCSGSCPAGSSCPPATINPVLCPNGTYCPRGSALPQNCPEGYHGARPGLVDETQCEPCNAGFQCVAGSAAQTPCITGTYSASNRSVACNVCADGTYQDLAAQTACKACTPGSFCPAGSTAPSLCPAGTFARSYGNRDSSQCQTCLKGFYCPAGSPDVHPCTPGTKGESAGLRDVSECVECTIPTHSVAGQSECDGCISTYYLVPDAASASPTERCAPCPAGASCDYNSSGLSGSLGGFTLANIILDQHYWRISPTARTMSRCVESADRVSACRGGRTGGDEGGSYCVDGHHGPRCQLCSNASFYFDDDVGLCEECPRAGDMWRIAGTCMGMLALAALLFGLLHLHRFRWLMTWMRRFTIKAGSHALIPKLKLLIAFYQSAVAIPRVYDVALPPEYYQWMRLITVFDINWDFLVVPGACLPGGFRSRLLLRGLAPLAVMLCGGALRLLYVLGRDVLRGVGVRRCVRHVLDVLPVTLFVLFCFCGTVSKGIFATWSCLPVEDGRENRTTRRFLLADLAIECDPYPDEAYLSITTTASVFVFVWPIGVPLLFLVVLLPIRRYLLQKRSTRLVQTTAFLHREYKPAYFFWESIFLAQRLAITGFVEYMPRDFNRLQTGLLLTILYTLLLLYLRPYKRSDVGILAVGVQIALLGVFFGALNIRLYGDLSAIGSGVGGSAVDPNLAQSITGWYSTSQMAMWIFACNMVGMALFFGMLGYQVLTRRDTPTIRLVDSAALPELSLGPTQRYHIFLSHVWSSGQDQAATIKRQLQLLLPGVTCFLDVDNLEDISMLEQYIDETSCVLVFLSKGYFFSKNCLRELDHALALKKPLILLHEADLSHGGADLATITAECESRGRTAVFNAGGPILTWQRIAEFQIVVLRQIAGQMLHATPAYRRLDEPPEVYVPGDLSMQAFVFSAPTSLFVSGWNPGAINIAEELKEVWLTRWGGRGKLEVGTIDRRGAARPSVTWEEEAEPTEDDFPASSSRSPRWFKSPKSGTERALPADATHFLLYLNEDTFVGQNGQRLAHEVRRVRREGVVPIVLVHENDPERGGCAFDRLFHTTPEDLISDGLYKKIAISFMPPPMRDVSMALGAKAVGAEAVQNLLVRIATAPAKALRNSIRASLTSSSSMRASDGGADASGISLSDKFKRHKVRQMTVTLPIPQQESSTSEAPAAPTEDELEEVSPKGVTMLERSGSEGIRGAGKEPIDLRRSRSMGNSPCKPPRSSPGRHLSKASFGLPGSGKLPKMVEDQESLLVDD